jgi:hypothetical protein
LWCEFPDDPKALPDVLREWDGRKWVCLPYGISDEYDECSPHREELQGFVEAHNESIARKASKVPKSVMPPNSNGRVQVIDGEDHIVISKVEFDALLDWVLMAHAMQVQQDESDPIIKDGD